MLAGPWERAVIKGATVITVQYVLPKRMEKKMTTLGVSVYPDIRPLDEIVTYFALASKYGFTRVFSSMFSVEGTNEEVLALFRDFNAAAHEYGMRVSLDINPECMDRLGATPQDLSVFADIKADILRMDGAYGEDDNVAMLQNPYGMQIEYNASALQADQIIALVERGVSKDRILACHNFYPQRYTGFRWDKFCAVNDRLAALDIPIGAFVASQVPGTHGVWDPPCGLPTVERLRDYPADLQARILAAAKTTDVFFGNAYASEAELAAVQEAFVPVGPHYVSAAHKRQVDSYASYAGSDLDLANQKKVRVEPVFDLLDVEKTILFDFFPHIDMGDSSEWIWRDRSPRLFFQDQAIVPRRYPNDYFQVGDVVMVNDNYKHYAGEVQVVLEPIKNDGTRNLVGRINAEELTMFDVIGDGDIVVFMPAR